MTKTGALALVVVCGLASQARGEAKLNELETMLTIAGTPSAARGVTLELAVTNRGKTAQRFCRYHTPFEGVRNHFVEIVDASGKQIEYRGVMAKRAAPTASDWQKVAPGATQRARFDLREGYALAPGRYTLRFLGGAVSGLPDSKPITITIGP